MVYSLTEWPRMRRAAVSEGFDVIAWWSPLLSEGEGAAAALNAGWHASEIVSVVPAPEACADLVARPNHFPYGVVVDQGRAHAWPILGVMPDDAWIESLLWRQRALRQVAEGASQ
jgi:hypothetical protein